MTPRTLMLLVVVLLAAVPSAATAQVAQAGPCPYVTCAVRHTIGFTGERLVRGETSEEVLKISFTGSNAADFLGRVESARGPANDFRTRRKRAAFLGVIAGVAAGYFFGVAYDVSDDGVETYPKGADYAVLVVGVGAGIWGGLESTRSRNSLSRAIWEFNRAPIP